MVNFRLIPAFLTIDSRCEEMKMKLSSEKTVFMRVTNKKYQFVFNIALKIQP